MVGALAALDTVLKLAKLPLRTEGEDLEYQHSGRVCAAMLYDAGIHQIVIRPDPRGFRLEITDPEDFFKHTEVRRLHTEREIDRSMTPIGTSANAPLRSSYSIDDYRSVVGVKDRRDSVLPSDLQRFARAFEEWMSPANDDRGTALLAARG